MADFNYLVDDLTNFINGIHNQSNQATNTIIENVHNSTDNAILGAQPEKGTDKDQICQAI